MKLKEDSVKAIAVIKAKRGLISTIISIVLIVIAVVAVQRAWNYSKLEKENKELQSSLSEANANLENLSETQAQLEYSEEQVKLLKESTNALKKQVSALTTENEELNNKLEEFLRVQNTPPVITRAVLEEQMVSLSELVTKKYWYRNATESKEAKEWLWGVTMPLSDIRFVAMYDGFITAGIDLKEVKFNVNEQAKTITVTIPKSKIFDHNIPQETINVVVAQNNLFNSISFSDYNRFISSEKNVMEKTAIGQGILTEADQEAKEIIKAFLGKIPGMDNYTLKFN